MLKSKTMILFIILVLGVAYLGTSSNTTPRSFEEETNNIAIISE